MPDYRYAAALVATCLAAPVAMAQDAPVAAPAAAPAAAACELHVWPAARVSAVTQGLGAGLGILGALVDGAAHADQNKRDTAFITGALDAGAQARVLRDMDLPSALHLPPSQVIIHEQGIDLKSDNPARLSDSKAKCYNEFVVRSLLYFKNAVYKGQMRTFMGVRGFDGDKVTFDFRDSRHENLEVKLPKEGEDTGPATDALLKAFKGDVAFFTDKFVKKNKR